MAIDHVTRPRGATAPFDHLWFCDRITPEIDRFVASVTGVDLTQDVPTCPDWDVADLVRHIGGLHRWVARMVRELSPQAIPSVEMNLQFPEPAELPAWLAAGAAPLVDALRQADPNAAMWTWGADEHVRFWSRRMVHETAMHRIDADLTQGRAAAFDMALAVDGIDEFLVNVRHAAYWSPCVLELEGDGQALTLVATDAAAAWTITLEPDGFRWARGESGHASVRVAGTALDLDLLLWNRRTVDDPVYDVTGDRALAAWFQEKADL